MVVVGRLPKISDSEWKVMEIVWEKGFSTSTDIIETLKRNSLWSPKTIHTYIRRLVNKGVLGVNETEALNQYYPLISEEKYQNEETEKFIKKIYNGSTRLIISNFIKNEKLTKEEIDELKEILDKKSK